MDAPTDEAQALESLLRWYAAMGVDAPVDEAPHDRFAEAPSVPPARPATALPRRAQERPTTARPVSDASRPADTLIAEAEALAQDAGDLADLEARWASAPGCTLSTVSRMIAAHMPSGASLLMLAGQPGEDDERAGTIFAGASGRLLDAMLAAIGLTREAVALAHVVPWRPPGNRAPTPLELAVNLPFCRRLVALAAPKILVCLGERAAQPVLGTKETLGKLRGRWLTYEGDGAMVKAMASFAPAYLLGQPLQKRRAWADLLMLEDAMKW